MEENYIIDNETPANSMQLRNCMLCNKKVRGRTDKKFCDDNCRNNYNNRLKAAGNNLVRNINHALGKNRRILESLFGKEEKVTRIRADKLLHNGFHFEYYTHQCFNKKGNRYFFCYDYGYLPMNNGWYIIVKRKEH